MDNVERDTNMLNSTDNQHISSRWQQDSLQVISAADALFRQSGGNIPLSLPPLCRKLHISLHTRRDAPGGFRAALLYRQQQALIISNAALPSAQQRFAVAHEIGHFLIDQGKLSLPEWRHESLCQLFAAHLLIPAEALRQQSQRYHGRHDLPARLAAHFGVSQQAMLIQLNSLKLLATNNIDGQSAADSECAALRKFHRLSPVSAGNNCQHCPLQLICRKPL